MRKRCQWSTMGGRPRMFHWAVQVQFRQFEKVPNFVVSPAWTCLTLQPTNFFIQTIEKLCVFTLIVICMQSLCFCNPLKYNTDYRIFDVPTWPFNSCVHTWVLFAFNYSVRLNGCLCCCCFFGGALLPLFFIEGLGVGPFYEILAATLVYVCV